MMKLLVVFVHNEEDAAAAAEALREQGFRFTTLHSSGGFLRGNSYTFLIGVAEEQREACLEVFRQRCKSRHVGAPGSVLDGERMDEEKYERYNERIRPLTVEVGGAVAFAVDAGRVL